MQRTKRLAWLPGILAAVLITLTTPSARAGHIIGGNIVYTCLGNGDYAFTLKIYRDCNCTDCAELDDIADIGIYRCSGDVDCGRLTQAAFFSRVQVRLKSKRNIDRPDYPCLIPPNICVEEGLYEFKLSDYGVRLPLSNLSYYVSYQRCCRNVTIANIVNPADAGATYSVEITPEAQAVCNHSPVFEVFPPTVVCVNAPLEFDHRAVDPEGDSLVYEFCAPFNGGGPLRDQFLYATCEGAYPQPACPPPYRRVSFRGADISASTPMGGDPYVIINEKTGLITGTPRRKGQFVVGVCVSEYRNGVLLGKIFRDFQFNVADCDPTVFAEVGDAMPIADQEYAVNSCGVTDIQFVNNSFQRQYVKNLEWRFNVKGQRITSGEWEPLIAFPGIGEYNGQLILNPGTECGDTAEIKVTIYPDLDADFTFAYDTCKAGIVQFTDQSRSGSGFLTNWRWDFGDGNQGRGRRPVHVFREPGDIPITLTVRDTNRCEETLTKILPYYPVPALVVVSPVAGQNCVPYTVRFDNLSFPIDSTYDIRWNFGDGENSSAISPVHTYEDVGTFNVSVSIVSPIGCETDTLFPSLISVLPAPEAAFDYSPKELSNLNNRVTFSDFSTGAVSWFWDLGTGATARERNPVYVFPDTGQVVVSLIVTHPSGCRDTVQQTIDIKPETRFFLPNAFTPNADGKNDVFQGVGIMLGATDFQLQIWNRWGELLFRSEDPQEGWNGRIQNSGQDVPEGVYVVLVTFRDPRGEPFEYRGFVTVVR